MVLSGKRRGACSALRWDQGTLLYRCGALSEPESVAAGALPKYLQWMRSPIAMLLKMLAPRWIASGIGCDSTLQTSATISEKFTP
jgi:hypothetical protein